MKENKTKLSKQNVSLIVIAVLIVVLAVVIGIGLSRERKTDATRTTSIAPTSASKVSSTTIKYVDDDGNDITPHFSKDGKKMMEGNQLATFEGMAWSTINGKKGLYYFTDATYDPTFTGLASGPNNRWYYVKNGKWDKSFTGFVSRAYYLRYVKNGVEQDDFNGTFYLDEFDDEGNAIKDGALYGFEMGRPDNWVFPLHKWHVEAD